MSLDPRLERRFSQLKKENLILRGEVNVLKSQQSNQGGGSPTRGRLNSFLNMTTIRKVAHPELYVGKGGTRVGPVKNSGFGLF